MFVGAKAVPFSAESAIMIEANAALEGCLFAMELGLTCVCFESDSKELMDSINGNIRRGRCCRTIEVKPGSLDIQTPHLTCACSQQRWSPLPANKCLMLCAGVDGSDSSELKVVLLSLT
ncbi:PREDICTED: LOW QUALITY PROTEIN uncharacterized [Prunus dulcis]|uniref:PREDICTED: LOW QUALITY PROTEIN uncharacterized n=1 Tax=Prunus dulcis TaxID=3755 RepID=A0A5E4F050_PRUDU|nr:hypothetical protein L3X38_005497 [Prunus dulcis]VVA20439.1 PREDICTED: LOW QUALITY PROTEIN uncharacterized [Prunus dulcis]